jgi:RHS repeat-associated protein
VSKFHYQLRADGKRLSVTDASGTTNYAYDDGGKLTQETGPYATIAYGYDNVGNRLTRTVTGSTTALLPNGTTTNTYDLNDRLTSGSHTYDNDGNEQTVNGQAASYDFENHLVALGSVANYVYDADGNRYSASNLGTTTSYVVDTSLPYASVVEEYTNGTLTARYDYGDDLLRMDRGSGVYYYLYDGLGSTRQLVNMSGTVTDSYGYSAFGEMALHTGSTVNPFLFNAQQFDQASGDYYLRARYYDQSNGRFISQDPFAGSNDDPVSLHRYLYANNDPVDRVDPSGKEPDLVSLSAVAGGIGTIVAVEAPAIEEVAMSAEETVGSATLSSGLSLVEEDLSSGEQDAESLFQDADEYVSSTTQLLRDGGPFRQGGTAVGRFFNLLGKTTEDFVERVLQQNKNLDVVKTQRGLPGPDFTVRLGNQIAQIEAKYSLNLSTTASLNRLVTQVNQGLASGNKTVIFSLVQPTIAQVQRVQNALGANANNVQFVDGAEGLYRWTKLFFGGS